jgi:hypothetical protein
MAVDMEIARCVTVFAGNGVSLFSLARYQLVVAHLQSTVVRINQQCRVQALLDKRDPLRVSIRFT